MARFSSITAGMIFTAASALASASVVSLSPTTQTVTSGDSLSLDLEVSGLGSGTALGAFDVTVGFNPSNFSLDGVTYGDPVLGDQLNLEGFGPVTMTTPGPGSVELFEVSLDDPNVLLASQPSSFTLATLTFDALSAGTSEFTLSANTIADQAGGALDAALVGARVMVMPSEAAPVPLPAGLGLLASGLGILAIYRRKSCRVVLPAE